MKKYIPIPEQQYCCVPACIQMILLRRKIALKPQEDIGYDLGLIVPKKDKGLFNKVRTGKKPKAGWGTQTANPAYSINKFFKKNKINLKENRVYLTDLAVIKKFLKENLKTKDIIVCFDYQKLYNDRNEEHGHVSLVENIKGDFVTLIDPLYRVPKYRKISLRQLSKAIEFHGENHGAGFWVIS